jgi:chemotaxis protein MotA
MNSSFAGYIFFIIAAYFLIVVGDPNNAMAIHQFQNQYFPTVLVRYIHYPGFLFVTFGVYASVLISFTFREIKSALRAQVLAFFPSKLQFENYIHTIREIADYMSKKDVETLEDYVQQIKYPFLRDGLLMVVNGYKKEEIHDILESRIASEHERDEIDDDVWRACARYSPGYGMLGTTVGLIQMFSASIDPAKGFGPIIAAMAVAFTTTLYGLVYSNFIYQPIADKIERRNTDEMLLKTMIAEGIMMLAEKKRPSYIEEKLTTYLYRNRSLRNAKIPELKKI